MEMKICITCKVEKPINCFGKAGGNIDKVAKRCKQCTAIYQKKYTEEHKEIIREYKKTYHKKNIEKCLKYKKDNKIKIAKQKNLRYKNNKTEILKYNTNYNNTHKERLEKWKIEHKEEMKEWNRKYGIKHREQNCINSQNYYARKRKLPATLTIEQWENIKLHFNNKCAYCGKKMPLAKEHFLAISKGGEFTHNNIIPSCKFCNSSKNNYDFFEWYPKYKYYSKKREKEILKFLNYSNKIQQLALIF